MLLLADHQTGVPDYAVKSPPRGLVEGNVLRVPRAATTLGATGRRRLITAGVGTDVCGVAPALHASRDGYQVTFVADAAGSLTAFGHDISLRRMEQAGITLATTATVIAGLTGDYPAYSKVMRG